MLHRIAQNMLIDFVFCRLTQTPQLFVKCKYDLQFYNASISSFKNCKFLIAFGS